MLTVNLARPKEESHDRSPDAKRAGELVEPERVEFRCALARGSGEVELSKPITGEISQSKY